MPREGMTGLTLKDEVAELVRSKAAASGKGINDYLLSLIIGPSITSPTTSPEPSLDNSQTVQLLQQTVTLLQTLNNKIPTNRVLGEPSCEEGSVVRSPGFEPGFLPWQGKKTFSLQSVDWESFEAFMLKEYHPLAMARCKAKYAREFAHCLFSGNLSDLRLLSDDKRCHVLKSLSALSKFVGAHTEFKAMVKNYGLKWGGKNPDDIIIARLTKPESSDEMYLWMRSVKTSFPAFKRLVDLMAATGLRYVEAINSWNLIVDLAREGKLGSYYEDSKQVLEHFRFKDIFIRPSKKAYISFVSRKMVQEIAGSKRLKMNALTCRVRKKGMKQRFGDIREFQGSLLTRTHSQPEIDFLHGRVSTGVFMTNYFNPAWISDLQTRTLKAAGEILRKIN